MLKTPLRFLLQYKSGVLQLGSFNYWRHDLEILLVFLRCIFPWPVSLSFDYGLITIIQKTGPFSSALSLNVRNFPDVILRTQLGMTQEELAGELNVTRQALSNWERDVNEPDLNMFANCNNKLNTCQ